MKAIPLKPGAPIACVATAGPVRKERLQRGLEFLGNLGHPVDLGASVLSRRGFLAGSDAARAQDLNEAIRRPDRPAIFFARGGWGTARILDRIDLVRLRSRPRVLVGYSDLTTLFMALQRRNRGYPLRYGPSVSELGDPGAFDRRTLLESLRLEGMTLEHDLRGCRVLRPGRAKGLIMGGCLTLLAGLLGTRHDFPWDGCILFWEEVNEEPYRIDRLLTHLRLAGKLRNLAGMIVGRLSGCKAKPPTPGLPMKEIVLEAVAGTNYPIVTNFPAGHLRKKRTLLLGVTARLDTPAGRLALSAR